MPEGPMPKMIRKKVIIDGQEVDLSFIETRKPAPVEGVRQTKESADGMDEKNLDGAGFGFCPPFNPRTYIAEAGILCEQDVAVKMRDGNTIYADIYRPVDQLNIPALISWSTFGKRPGEGFTEWQVIGVPRALFPGWLSSNRPTPVSGAARVMPSPMSTRPASVILRVIAGPIVPRMAGMPLTLSNGLPCSPGAVVKSLCPAIPG
jgi:hypothetical protein